jgi:hypothetical protein
MDPYVVSRLMVETVCGAASASKGNGKAVATSTGKRTAAPAKARVAAKAKRTGTKRAAAR